MCIYRYSFICVYTIRMYTQMIRNENSESLYDDIHATVPRARLISSANHSSILQV